MAWLREVTVERQVFHSNDSKESFLAPRYVGDDDRYELYDILSVAGGFGIIYRARDRRLNNHEVLIKSRRYDKEPGLFTFKMDTSRKNKIEKIRDKTIFEAECLKMFKQNRESRMPILNDIVFGFSPSIYGPHKDNKGEEYTIEEDYVNDEPYIVMQVINGTNLWELVKGGVKNLCENKGYATFYEWEKEVLAYGKELTTIFSEFHRIRNDEEGNYYYIYQDLKPENIMLSHDRFLTLLDFGGVTKVKLRANKNKFGNVEYFSEIGEGSPGLGTFGFQAPEARNRALIKSLDMRCDIYTLGATLFQLLTGFDLTQILETEDSEIPLERALKGVCSDETFNMLKKCLERDRDKRYNTMKEVRDDIHKCFPSVKEKIKDCEENYAI